MAVSADESKQIESYSTWQCNGCSETNILYNVNCKSCKKECAIQQQIELNIKNIIKTLVPSWSRILFRHIILRKMSTALSSRLYIVSNADYRYDDTRYAFRIYNPNFTNSKYYEIHDLFSNKLKIGPQIIKQFEFGQIEEYLNTNQSNRKNDLYNNELIYKNIAKKLAHIHSLKLNKIKPKKANAARGHGWIANMLKDQSKLLKNDKDGIYTWLTDVISEHYDKKAGNFIEKEWKWLKSITKKNDNDLYYMIENKKKALKFANSNESVLCHNDLNHRNILIKKAKNIVWSNRIAPPDMNRYENMKQNGLNINEIVNQMNRDNLSEYWIDKFINQNKTDKDIENDYDDIVRIIDYEYSGYCNRFWDFAHYFCELTIGIVPAPKYFEMKFSQQYPGINYRKKFVSYYLYEILKLKLKVSDLQKTTLIEDKYINLFVSSIEIGALWSHLTCIVWALDEWKKQLNTKEIRFDFKEYAIQRTHCYFQHKQIITDNITKANKTIKKVHTLKPSVYKKSKKQNK